MAKTQVVSLDAEKKMFTVTVDGKQVVVPEGTPVFDAVKKTGVELPAMCYHYAFSPFGSCGICLVEVEGKSNNVRSCTAKVADGMVVRTQTEKMIEARKTAVEKWLIIHPLDCPVCDADGKCELQDLTYELGVYDIKKGVRKQVPEDTRSPVLDFNMERCILCGQCINVCKEVQEIDALAFYKKDGKTLVGAHEGVPLDCEFCGDCLAVCPVGAITSRFSKYAYKPWQLKKTQTTCTYCSDGCAITLETEGPKVLRVTSQLSYLSKFGHDVEPGDDHGGLCVRGRFGFQFIQSEKRLSRPLAKVDGKQVEIPWFRAIPQIARKLKEIKEAYGGQAIAGLISGRCTNEEVYLFQKLMRATLGSNNIDTAARYGHMNSILTMQKGLGMGGSTTSCKQITLSDVILVVGSNITETNPVFSLRIKEAKRKFGAKVIVIDPIKTNMMKLSTHGLQVAMGGETALLQGLVKAVIDEGFAFPGFMEKYPKAYEALRQSVGLLSAESIAEACGIAWDKIKEAATLLAQSKRGTMIWGEGIVSKEHGQENVFRLMDMAHLCGLFTKPGAGVHPVCEENNEQGAVDMGGVPEFLPGQIAYANGRERFETLWNSPLPNAVGLTLPEMIEKAHQGEIKALYIVGENPIETLPASMKVREAFSKIDFIICQDPFLTKTGTLADFVLPATTYAEKTGTFTNMGGEIKSVDRAFDPIGESRPDFKIFCDIIRQMTGSAPSSVEAVMHEINQCASGYFDGERPTINPEHIAHYFENGFVEDVAKRYQNTNTHASSDIANSGMFHLVLGQSIYHSGKLSTRDEGLMKIYNKPTLKMSEEDATALEIKDGDWVRVNRPNGEALDAVEIEAEVMPSLPKRVVWFPEHFTNLNDLMDVEVDPVTHVPYFKSGEVLLKKVPLFDLSVVSSPCAKNGEEGPHEVSE
jgi:formate dehydrogenase alpha subunit